MKSVRPSDSGKGEIEGDADDEWTVQVDGGWRERESEDW
jgi:hypothetical protein